MGFLLLDTIPGVSGFTMSGVSGSFGAAAPPAIAATTGLYVGGDFFRYNGVLGSGSILLNTDGSKNSTFDNSKRLSGVRSFLRDSNQKLYMSGYITLFGSESVGYIVRANPDGTRDTAFDASASFNNYTFPLTQDSNGKLYVGGGFSTFKGQAAWRIIRLNPDGTKDTGFNPGTAFSGSSTAVNSIEIDTSGKLYMGGAFTRYSGSSIGGNIVRINPDGTRDTTFETGTGFSGGAVNKILIEPSTGKLYVVGNFLAYSGSTVTRIARINPDGTRDTTFNSTTGFDFAGQHLALDANGKLIVGGGFTTYKGVNAKGIIRLNSDGTRDTSFEIGAGLTAGAVSGSVNMMALDSNQKLYIGGNFSSYSGSAVPNIIRLNSDGSRDTAFTTTTGFTAAAGATSIPQAVYLI